MLKPQYLADLLIAVLGCLLLISVRNLFMSGEISLETQFVPTLLNGITSCTGLIVGFTITVIVITISQLRSPRYNPHRIYFVVFVVLRWFFIWRLYRTDA